jgi:hypothetical protein
MEIFGAGESQQKDFPGDWKERNVAVLGLGQCKACIWMADERPPR